MKNKDVNQLKVFRMAKQNHEVNEKMILAWLLKGHRLSVQSGIQVFNTTEARVYVARLRRKGYAIIGEWVTKYGYRYKEYFIKQDQQAA